MSASRKLFEQRKKRAIVLGIFDKRQHNRQYMRLISWYLPGKAFKEWTSNLAAGYGHLYIVQYLQQQGVSCTISGARWAAEYGYLHVIQYLQGININCDVIGANHAAMNGHIHVVQYLQEYNINCDYLGAKLATEKGHTNMVQDLNSHGIFY